MTALRLEWVQGTTDLALLVDGKPVAYAPSEDINTYPVTTLNRMFADAATPAQPSVDLRDRGPLTLEDLATYQSENGIRARTALVTLDQEASIYAELQQYQGWGSLPIPLPVRWNGLTLEAVA